MDSSIQNLSLKEDTSNEAVAFMNLATDQLGSEVITVTNIQDSEKEKGKDAKEVTATPSSKVPVKLNLDFMRKKSTLIANNLLKDTTELWQKATLAVKRKVVTPETEDILKETFEIYKIMLKDLGFRPVDISLAVSALCCYHKGLYTRTENNLKDFLVVKTLLHFMKFASGAYGWKLLYGYVSKNYKGMKEGITKKDEASVKALLEHTGISAEDLLQTRFTSSNIYAPGHYIALDRSSKSIVLAIRGTFHVRDAITDLMAKFVPFKDGTAHSGMLIAATHKGAELAPYIKELLVKYPEYKLVILGHSLGAGTASLLSVILHEDHGIPLHCYAYASPCVLSLDLANKCKHYITTVVVHDDIVPRLSLGSANDLKNCVKQMLEKKDQKVKMLFQIMSAGNNLGESTTQKIANHLKCSPKVEFEKFESSERLYPPGTVYYFYSDKLGSDKYDCVEESDPKLFEDIVVSYSMYIDHFPNIYEETLSRTLQNLETKALETKLPVMLLEERD